MEYNSIKSAITRVRKETAMLISNRSHPMVWDIIEMESVSKFVYETILEKNNNQTVWKWSASDPDCVSKHFINARKVTNITKYRSFQYRLLHKAIVTNVHLYKWKLRSSPECEFCELFNKTLEHLFFQCEKVQNLWKEVEKFAKELCPDSVCDFTLEKTIFGTSLMCLSNPFLFFARPH